MFLQIAAKFNLEGVIAPEKSLFHPSVSVLLEDFSAVVDKLRTVSILSFTFVLLAIALVRDSS